MVTNIAKKLQKKLWNLNPIQHPNDGQEGQTKNDKDTQARQTGLNSFGPGQIQWQTQTKKQGTQTIEAIKEDFIFEMEAEKWKAKDKSPPETEPGHLVVLGWQGQADKGQTQSRHSQDKNKEKLY